MRSIIAFLLIAGTALGQTTLMTIQPDGSIYTTNGFSLTDFLGVSNITHSTFTIGGEIITVSGTTVFLDKTLYWVEGEPYIQDPGGIPGALVSYAFPDLSVTEPTTNYPAGFAAFDVSDVITNAAAADDTPQIAEWTRQNDPGDTMALTVEGIDYTPAVDAVYGPDVDSTNMLTNGTFDTNVDGWDYYSNPAVWTNGKARVTGSGGPYQAFELTSGIEYRFSAESSDSSVSHLLRLCSGDSPNAGIRSTTPSTTGTVHTITYTPSATGDFCIYLRSESGGAVSWDDVSMVTDVQGELISPKVYPMCGMVGFVFASNDGVGAGNIQRFDNRLAAVTLPSTLPANDMYLLWPHNEYGFGEPVGINQTEAWWAGPDLVATGETFSVYGQNLDLGDGLCQAYIVGHGWITNTAANPYKVDFEVPDSLTNGTYTIYAHNGHGLKYGWSDPITFEVDDPIIWDEDTNNWFDVTDYGATGDGVTDDYTNIMACVTAAKAVKPATVYFPAGTYIVGERIFPNSGQLRYKGAGMDLTILQGSDNFLNVAFDIIDIKDESAVEDMEINKGDSNIDCLTLQKGTESTVDRVLFNRVRFSSLSRGVSGVHSGGAAVDFSSGRGVFLNDCEFLVAWAIEGGTSEQVFFNNCNFKMIDDNNGLIGFSGTGFSMENCYAEPLDASITTTGTGWGKGRWIHGGGSVNNLYVGSNISSNMAPRLATPYITNAVPVAADFFYDSEEEEYRVTVTLDQAYDDLERATSLIARNDMGETGYPYNYGYTVREVLSPSNVVLRVLDSTSNTWDLAESWWFEAVDTVDQNSGEQFMWEGMRCYYWGYPSSVSDASTLVFSDLTNNYDDMTFTIAEGTGMGQSSKLTSDDTSGGTVKLITPLRVLPDETSLCKIGLFMTQMAFYDNDLNGTDRASTPGEYTATAGVNMYGGSSKTVVDGNRIAKVNTGVTIWSMGSSSANANMQPNVFNVVKNNMIDTCQNGIKFVVKDWGIDMPDDVTFFGSVMRNNTITNSTVQALASSASDGRKRIDMTVFDSNTIVSNAAGIVENDTNVWNQVWVGNMFDGAGTAYTISTNNTVALQDNIGFTYGGWLPGPILELPQRAGYTNQTSFEVWNSGVSNLIITANGQTVTNNGTITYSTTNATSYLVSAANGHEMTFYVLAPSEEPAAVWTDYTNAVIDTSTYNTALNSIADLQNNPTNITWDVGAIAYSYAGYYAMAKLEDDLGWTLENGGLSATTDNPETYLNLGPELVTNGTFTTGTEGWVELNSNGTITATGGIATYTRLASGGYVNFGPITVSVGRYLGRIEVVNGKYFNARISSSLMVNGSVIANNSSSGTYASIIDYGNTTAYFGINRGANGSAEFDNCSLREILPEED